MKLNLYLWMTIVVLMLFSLSGCTDLIETDISKKDIVLYAPKDNIKTKNYTNTFWWQEVTGATQYRLQVVQTDTLFRDSINLILDTVVSKTQFSKTLSPGNYLWSVFGQNNAYKSHRSAINRLQIDSNSIRAVNTTITSPLSGTYTNDPDVNLTWDNLYSATSYILDIDSVGTPKKKNTTSTSYSFTCGKQGKYQFTVSGSDGKNNSLASPLVYIYFDSIAPDTSSSGFLKGTLSTSNNPPQSVSRSLSGVLEWNPVDDKNGTGLKEYDLFVAPVSGGLGDPVYSGTATSYSLSGLSPAPKSGDIYQWQVKAYDKANNQVSSRVYYFRFTP